MGKCRNFCMCGGVTSEPADKMREGRRCRNPVGRFLAQMLLWLSGADSTGAAKWMRRMRISAVRRARRRAVRLDAGRREALEVRVALEVMIMVKAVVAPVAIPVCAVRAIVTGRIIRRRIWIVNTRFASGEGHQQSKNHWQGQKPD